LTFGVAAVSVLAGCGGGDHSSGSNEANEVAVDAIHLTADEIDLLCKALAQQGGTNCAPESPPGEHPELAPYEARVAIAQVSVSDTPPDGQKPAPGAQYMRGQETLDVQASCADVLAKVEQPAGWTWWRDGNIQNVVQGSTHGVAVEFDMSPVTRPFAPALHLSVGLPSQADDTWVIPLTFGGAFVGPGTVRLTENYNGCKMVHTWDGVQGAAFPPQLDVKMHFLAASGQFPFQWGTGFVGLAFDLQNSSSHN
jgi:hypothetical protein